jgi:endonuclease-3
MVDKQKAIEIVKLLKKEYPHAKYYLNFSNPLELLVAAILSAQVRDEVVNATTANLFKKYRSAKDYATADLQELIDDIKSVTFAGNKARHIKEACKILVEKYNGKVPNTMEELTSLPGVGRKTANTILINAFGKVEGIPVDTWVIKVSNRLGWVKTPNPEEIEQKLMEIIPKSEWKTIAYRIKAHGRAVCQSIPYCSKCPLNNLCPKCGVTKHY